MSSRKKASAKKPARKRPSTQVKPAKKTPAKKTSAKKTSAKKALPTKRSAAVTVSPLRGMPVLHWVRSHASAWQAGVIANLIDLVSGAVPDVTCSIKWAQPVFELNGPMAFIKLAAEHVTFGFWRGAELTDPAGLLEGGERMKHLKIGDDEAFDRTRVINSVVFSLLTAIGGNPHSSLAVL